jgi:hypothetical protein
MMFIKNEHTVGARAGPTQGNFVDGPRMAAKSMFFIESPVPSNFDTNPVGGLIRQESFHAYEVRK